MQKFILAYQGGTPPKTKEEGAEQMAKWHQWTESLGAAVINPGMPLGKAQAISKDGACDVGALGAISGISIIQAGSIEEAVKLSENCPFLDTGGTIDVAPIMEM